MSQTIEHRLSAMEGELASINAAAQLRAADQGKGKDRWDKLGVLVQAAGPIVTGLVIGYFGYAIKDSVDLALHRQEIEISSASQMQAMIQQLQKPNISDDEAKAAGLALAAFGVPAINLLLYELQAGNANAQLGAEEGLLLLAMTHSQPACEAFSQVLNEGRLHYAWPAHLAVIRLVGRGRCEQARVALKQFQAMLPDEEPATVASFAAKIDGNPAPTVEDVRLIRSTLGETLNLLGGADGPASP
jgi:hypothetical protein